MRFRTEEVAFMGDIEAMFYQVKVPDSQKSFLGYLWWNNYDMNGELVDFEMSVHVFGGDVPPNRMLQLCIEKNSYEQCTKL